MACSIERLFHLSPSASQFEPDLFSRILPALNQDGSLAMAIYLRTGETDVAAKNEEDVRDGKANATQGESQSYRERAKSIIDCAMQQETRHLENGPYARVVWVVVTDSRDLKQWITGSYDKTHVRRDSKQIPREVVTTRSRGVHTRGKRQPSTADFAEALIDWYLIGESDLVILDNGGPSFGGTAALRTARPVYDATNGTCYKRTPSFVYYEEMKMRRSQCEQMKRLKGSEKLSPACICVLNVTDASGIASLVM
jgi:hypothetical protein